MRRDLRRRVRDIERLLTDLHRQTAAVMDKVTHCPTTDTDDAWTVLLGALGHVRSVAEQADRLLDLRLELTR